MKKKLRRSFPKSKFLRERKILISKKTKLRKKNQTIRVKNSLLNIEELLLKSHEKEHIYNEQYAIDCIKSDPNYFFQYGKKNNFH